VLHGAKQGLSGPQTGALVGVRRHAAGSADASGRPTCTISARTSGRAGLRDHGMDRAPQAPAAGVAVVRGLV